MTNETITASVNVKLIGGHEVIGFNICGNGIVVNDSIGYNVTSGNNSAKDSPLDNLRDLSFFKPRVIPHLVVSALCLLQNIVLLALHFATKRVKDDGTNYFRCKMVSFVT